MYNNDPTKASPSINAEQILEKFVLEALVEQRRKRRWGIFFKLFFAAIVSLLMWGFFPWNSIFGAGNVDGIHKKHIGIVSINGELNAERGVNAQDTIDALEAAAKDKNTQAIILDINSPGGSPVQSSYIYHEIRHLQKTHKNLPIDAVCEDVCASGAYYVASASNNIYADPTSIVGSIGVIMDGFGFVDTMNKVGASRRVYTAGKYKDFLDPFTAEKPAEVQYMNNMLAQVHQTFINDVKQGRGSRLKDNPDLFTGLFWSGQQALALGLIDGLGSPLDVARDHYHNENLVDYTMHKNYIQLMFDQFGTTFWHHFSTELKTMHLN